MSPESLADAQHEMQREHHKVLAYTNANFPQDENILYSMQSCGRLVSTERVVHLDEGIFFDSNTISRVDAFKDDLLNSIALTLRQNDRFRVDDGLLIECLDVPDNVILAEMAEMFPKVGETSNSLLPSTYPESIALLRRLLPEKTLEHEQKHWAQAYERDRSAYFLFPLLLGVVGSNLVIEGSGGFTHHKSFDPFDGFCVSMAPKFPSSGDFRLAAKDMGKMTNSHLDEARQMIAKKSETIAYVEMQGKPIAFPVRIPDMMPQEGRIFDIGELFPVDPRTIGGLLGRKYAADQFCSRYGIPRDKVVTLGATTRE